MSKSRKQKRIFKKPLTKAELEGAAAYELSQKMQPHQRLEFAKALHSEQSANEEDLSYAHSLAKKAQDSCRLKIIGWCARKRKS